MSAAGQTAQVGAATPSLSLSGPGELDLFGPGELDLFGQVMPTKPTFAGPIRPLLQLPRITSTTQYYSPFGTSIGCLRRYHITAAKEQVLLSRLAQLNSVLAQGAQTFVFAVADPPFAGHELRTADPWVQGTGDPAPLHPTAAGELAIALADQQALPEAQNLVPAPSRGGATS